MALINKLSRHIDIAAVVFSKNIPRRRPDATSRAKTLANRVGGRFFGRELRDVWNRMLAKYSEDHGEIPVENQTNVDNVNDPSTVEVITKYSPELVLVSGTNLVGAKVIEAAQRSGKLMNLHTGISPYVKGGPNCTNWCLAKGWFHLIGNTIMWLDRGIDTGNIIATERTPLDGSEDLFELHWKVMEHGHDLYVRALRKIINGDQVNDVAQNSIADGTLFRSSQWGVAPMRQALRNFRSDYRSFFANGSSSPATEVKLFPIQ